MSKTKSILASLLSLALAIVFIGQHNTPFETVAFALTIIFAMVYATKFDRDTRIKDQARREKALAAQTPPVVAQASKGSHGIFVPPPLQNNRVEE